ncbi:MAG TPA: hypothetical protein VJ124_04480 [Pyrinomonadaceae bacterium]|nr:hypothetical protein [Pyrinomonadaceae bacterium]
MIEKVERPVFSVRGEQHVTICPCCGCQFAGNLSEGCDACGARSVGLPLPKPDHELPSYGRSLLLAVSGLLLLLVFVEQTIVALAKNSPISLDFSSWMAALETAAWRLKWVAIPTAILVFCGSRKLYRSVIESPSRFCGVRYARAGYLTSLIIPAMIALLIGITVPGRLVDRQWSIEVAPYAQGYTIDRALREYQAKFGRLPNDLSDLRQLPDPDHSIANALGNLDTAYPNAYKPSADVAVLPKQKPRPLRGAIIRNATLNNPTEDALAEGLSFTNYELRLPGADKLMGTEDDLLLRDGVNYKVSEMPRQAGANRKSLP